MGYTIERVRPGDEAALAHIHAESWNAGFRDILSQETLRQFTQVEHLTSMYRQLLAQPMGSGYLLRVDGAPHCMAWWAEAREPEYAGYAELICIHSLPNRWRMGYGSRMLETVLHDAAAAGYSKIMLWVFADNLRARRFYEAHGFTATRATKPGIESTELCYEKALSAR